MVELSPLRKNKICLEDYDYKQDIENRLLMAQFSSLDLEVLEEILYSSIKIPIRKLAKNIDCEEAELLPILNKLSQTGLFVFEEDSIVVDKEMRKYFEAQILKFEPDFRPGMEFLQSLLRKVPIHVLPIWYSIPRTSNNIFDSLVEKYLLTPQIFQRYLLELSFQDPHLTAIVEEVYHSPKLKVYAKDLIEKLQISKEKFEEYLLLLEFHFVCCLGYEKAEDRWLEVVTPFQEWREYALHLNDTYAQPLAEESSICETQSTDFSFIQEMSQILTSIKKQPLKVEVGQDKKLLFDLQTLPCKGDLHQLIAKMRQVRLADVVDGRLCALEGANDFLEMRLDHRALFLYRHPLNRLHALHIPSELITDRNLREVEKSISRVLDRGWIYFDEFLKGVIIPLSDDSVVMLKKQGKAWRYTLPSYKEEELALIKSVILEWLFEVGVTAVGTHEGREVFRVTPFGQSLFGR